MVAPQATSNAQLKSNFFSASGKAPDLCNGVLCIRAW
jgi:hypothetical protein